MQTKIHLVGLPHTRVSQDFILCAFTQKIRNFLRMFSESKYQIVYYGNGVETKIFTGEQVQCTDDAEVRNFLGERSYNNPDWNSSNPFWENYILRVSDEISLRIGPRDLIATFMGGPFSRLKSAFPGHIVTELGIGYEATFSNFRVWESYAWMHLIYGQESKRASVNGKFFDDVIHGFLDQAEFTFNSKKENFLLFLGRVIPRKGIQIAVDIARESNTHLVVAGPGQGPNCSNVTYLGEVDATQRASLLASAKALIAPTIYIEPFGNVVIEAQVSGTPTITTDWGAFVETNQQGITGFRCRTLSEFNEAVQKVDQLNPEEIRSHAIEKYSLSATKPKYERHLSRLETLYENGWYQQFWHQS